MKTRSPLMLLSLSLFIWGIGEGMFVLFHPLYLQKLGANPVRIGQIFGAFGLMMTVAHLPAGTLSDRWGARPLLRWSWATGLIATLIMASARNLPLFVAGMLLYGVTAAVSAPLSSYVTAARGEWPVARALTTISATFNGGMILGPSIGGWIANTSGLGSIYRVSVILFVFSTLLIWMLPALREQPSAEESARDPQPLLLNHRYLIFLGLVLISTLGMYLPQPLTPNFLQNIHGLDYSTIGRLGTIGGLGNVLLSLGLGAWSNWLAAFLSAQGAVLLFVLLLGNGASTLAFGLGYFFLGGYRAGRSLMTAKIRDLVHANQTGVAFALAETSGGLVLVLAPMLAGWFFSRQPTLMYHLSAGILLISLLATWAFNYREAKSA